MTGDIPKPVNGTELKRLLRQKHWQTHGTFLRQYDKVAAEVEPSMVGHGPQKAQFYRWLTGEIKGLPYPYHCRVLEAMLPGCTVEELFAPAEKSRTERVADRDRLRLVTAAGEPNDSPDSVVGSADEQICSPDLGVARQVDQIGPPDPVVGSGPAAVADKLDRDSSGPQREGGVPGISAETPSAATPFDRDLRIVDSFGAHAEPPASASGSGRVRDQREVTASIDARLRSLMSWIGDTAPIKERDIHGGVQWSASQPDRRRSR